MPARSPTKTRPKRGRPVRPGLALQRREEILVAATRRFAACGYHQTDLQVLADELDVGKGTLYRYFASKERLFLAAVDRAMRLLTARIDEMRADGGDPLELIARVVRTYLAFFDEHPEFVELFIQERAVFRTRKTPTYFEHRARNSGRWQAMYDALMEAGRVRRMSPQAISDVVSSTLYGTMFTNFFAGRQKSLETQTDQIVDIIFGGILTDDERRRRQRASRGRRTAGAGHS